MELITFLIIESKMAKRDQQKKKKICMNFDHFLHKFWICNNLYRNWKKKPNKKKIKLKILLSDFNKILAAHCYIK